MMKLRKQKKKGVDFIKPKQKQKTVFLRQIRNVTDIISAMSEASTHHANNKNCTHRGDRGYWRRQQEWEIQKQNDEKEEEEEEKKKRSRQDLFFS
jgi:hypothetical protein